jgi:hypothetical protein
VIRYALTCENDDEFEGWFASSADYDDQETRGIVECPVCGSKVVRKAPMAPAVGRSKAEAASRAAMVEQVRSHIREKFDYVGTGFAEEARAINDGDAPDRPIWGEATPAEAKALADEGLPVAPLPAPFAPTPPRKLN